MNWRVLTLLLLIGLVILFGISLYEPLSGVALSASTQFQAPPQETDGFVRAISPWDWQFPRDYGAHPAFQTEWWYYTGVLATEAGERFGFQFTIFRRAISPLARESDSEFRSNDIYMAHFTVSDIKNGDFYHDVRYARGGAGLAGATVDPFYRVWLEDWAVSAEDDNANKTHISAASADFAIDLHLYQMKRPALHGDGGLSQKSGELGNASYYYSLTRLLTDGGIRVGDQEYTVSGYTWMDHEFSTSALGESAQGWDWFGLIFTDGTELMVGQIRQVDGSREPAFGGLYIEADGGTRYLDAADFSIHVSDTWRSPQTGAEYPAGWEIAVKGDAGFSLQVAPLLADQELHDASIIYWEGAVEVSGDKSGAGYAELTGYVDSMQNRF
ncbi:MAG: carotenoid 1,2-hydratase [Chloroflexota bacterium]|nr:carotenoid 1,2-hydratase [Chloroflexota bacterium]MDE2948039.1 carotenoid 1,2-hydratase [Chloroflexota bacterium]